jgi:aryl-alcohol dehydrogenase
VPQKFIPKLIKLYQAERFPFDGLMKFYGFTQINGINGTIADSRGSTIEPVLLVGQATTAS